MGVIISACEPAVPISVLVLLLPRLLTWRIFTGEPILVGDRIKALLFNFLPETLATLDLGTTQAALRVASLGL